LRTDSFFRCRTGTHVDWLRNVLSAGRATITAGGQTYDVVEPEIIDAATAGPSCRPGGDEHSSDLASRST